MMLSAKQESFARALVGHGLFTGALPATVIEEVAEQECSNFYSNLKSDNF
jgi:hypothetical protein